MILRFVENLFTDEEVANLGDGKETVDKIVKTKRQGNVKLQLWDTAGQEKFR